MSTLPEIAEAFELLGDWDARYQYLVELGGRLPPFPEQHMIERNKVKGCMSSVYILAYTQPGEKGRVHYMGYCDTDVIRGVLAILVDLLSGKDYPEILAFDVDRFFEQLNLAEHLSPNRHFGIYAIVELMKTLAANPVENSTLVA